MSNEVAQMAEKHGKGAGSLIGCYDKSAEPEQQSDCLCPPGTCQPRLNEGCYCWRSLQYIPPGHFAKRSAVAESSVA